MRLAELLDKSIPVAIRIATRRKLAKGLAKAHGCKGAAGGWISTPLGDTICQGWTRYFEINADRIDAHLAVATWIAGK